MAVYWRTREFWAACDPPRSTWQPAMLRKAHPDVNAASWGYRRRIAEALNDEEGWGLSFPEFAPGRHDQMHDPKPEAVTLPTPEERVERDKDIMRLEERVREAESKLKAAYREHEVEDRIVAHMERIVPALPRVKAPTILKRTGGKPETAVMLTSDYHVGEVVSIEETGGLAHYDWDTFLKRWQYHVDSVGGICFGKLTGYDLPNLVVPMLGDMVTGIIHDELRETAEGTVMEWVCEGGHAFAQGIRQLAAEFSTVTVDCVIGNHGRLDRKPRFKRRYVSFDYLLYRFVELELRDLPHVTVNVHKSFYSLVDVPGATLLNLHGDNIRSWSGIPWYGINRAVTNLSLLLSAQRRGFDVVNLGHFHNSGTLDRIDGELVLNGSAVGGNEYSIGALFTSSRPAQVLYGVHPERGKTWEFKLDLSHGDTHEARWAAA